MRESRPIKPTKSSMPNVKDKDGSAGGRVKELASSFGSGVSWTVEQIKEKANHILCEYGNRIGEHVVNSVEDAIHKTFPFIDLASNAVKTDVAILQLLSNVRITYKGATWRDKLQYSIGLCEMLLGTFITGAGGAATVMSGGSASVVSVPLVNVGATITMIGFTTSALAIANMYEIQFFQSSGDGGKGESNYGDNIEVSSKKMYRDGYHYNKHGRSMGYTSKKDYEAGAREFIEKYKGSAEIYEGKWNGTGVQNGETQIIIRKDGKQAIINKATGQIIDFYEGTDLKGFIEIRRVQ